MLDIENGMVVGADAEWERLNADTPYDKADIPQMESYLWDVEEVATLVEWVCGLDEDAVTEEEAVAIYDHLNRDEVDRELRRWFENADRAKYDKWWHERNDWMYEKDGDR